MKDTEEETRLSILYACDAFIRHVRKMNGSNLDVIRDKVIGRFSAKLGELFSYLDGVSAADKRGTYL